MREAVLLLLLVLAGHAPKPGPALTTTASAPTQWRLPTGNPPSEAEFAAVLAACRDDGKRGQQPVDPCLGEQFGMHRVQ